MKRWTERAGLGPRIACAVAVYNKPKELEMCLEGYRRQSFLSEDPGGLQLILADDGSRPEIEGLFARYARSVPFQATYLRQEDRGWGKIRMLNWAALECRAPRIIFTDGDCVPHRHFIARHAAAADPNVVACGRRVDVMEKAAAELTLDDVRRGRMESLGWLLPRMARRDLDFGEQGIYLPALAAKMVPLFSKNPRPTLVGSNFSIDRVRLLDLNGFDETFRRPGYGEDTDLERRALMAGMKLEWITYRAIQFHLWHPLTPVGEDVKRIYEDLEAGGSRTARRGARELQPEIERLG